MVFKLRDQLGLMVLVDVLNSLSAQLIFILALYSSENYLVSI